MIQVNIHEAKSQLSRLLAQVQAGEIVIIARAGVPIARLSACEAPASGREFGRDRGLFEVPDDFDEPLPADVLAAFES